MKSAYGLKKNEKLSVTNSLYYGIRILATKGYRGGVRYDNKTGKITYEFRGWGMQQIIITVVVFRIIKMMLKPW